MKMSDISWIRRADYEDSFTEMYDFTPEIYYFRESRNSHYVKLNFEGKEAILHEVLSNGVTKKAELEFNSEKRSFDTYKQAEEDATTVLKEGIWPTYTADIHSAQQSKSQRLS